jgi:hypothetical protein
MENIQIFPERGKERSVATILIREKRLKKRLVPNGPFPVENKFAIRSQHEQSAKLIGEIASDSSVSCGRLSQSANIHADSQGASWGHLMAGWALWIPRKGL